MSGYATRITNDRRCPTCNGTGINPVATYMVCPKCNGEKRVPEAKPMYVGGTSEVPRRKTT